MFSADKIVRKYSDLKTLPHVAIKVNQLIKSGNATMRDFEEIIKLDPVLITRMLKLVNSPYFGLVNKIESISKAVVFMGMANLRNLVAIEALRDIYKDEVPVNGGFSRTNLWFHSATVAILSEMIAKRIFGLAGEDCFLAGIIHDIGMVAEDQVAGDLLRKAFVAYIPGDRSIIEFEREIVGTDHCKVGGALAREWGLPDEVLKAVRFHHDKEREFPPESAIGIVQLAEYFAGKMKYSVVKGQVEPLAPSLVSHVKQKLDNYKVIVKDLPGEMAKARELYGESA
ncbi:MAG: HDOD domain-containing protein [Proteobacteria bacterium]|nr:HDOD domain-containing protein [Pseudomonadota bacterium]MBU1736603.1 HDOD domain-containing protein [Pseudomonadota bacterium]